MRKEIVGAMFTFVVLVGPSEPSTAQASNCDKPCLVDAMDKFLDEMTGNAVPALPYSPSVEVRENARRVELADSAWRNVERVRSSVTFADPIARRYFQNLTDHSPDPEDHVDSCNRYHSGQQISLIDNIGLMLDPPVETLGFTH